eukprot:sb/3478542/
MIYSVYIINKAGGRIYDEDFATNKPEEEVTFPAHPIPLVLTADTGKILVKFGASGNVKPGMSVIAVNRQPVTGLYTGNDQPILEIINDPASYPLSLTFGR